MGQKRNAHRILIQKPERMMPLGRSRHRQKYNIRTTLQETGWEGTDWTHLT
jgi:hypothetical protein